MNVDVKIAEAVATLRREQRQYLARELLIAMVGNPAMLDRTPSDNVWERDAEGLIPHAFRLADVFMEYADAAKEKK